jgi:hypothetical protein
MVYRPLDPKPTAGIAKVLANAEWKSRQSLKGNSALYIQTKLGSRDDPSLREAIIEGRYEEA